MKVVLEREVRRSVEHDGANVRVARAGDVQESAVVLQSPPSRPFDWANPMISGLGNAAYFCRTAAVEYQPIPKSIEPKLLTYS